MIPAEKIAQIRTSLFSKIEKTKKPIRDDLERKHLVLMGKINNLVGDYLCGFQKVQLSITEYHSNVFEAISNLEIELKNAIKSKLYKYETLTQKLLDNFTSTFGEGCKTISDIENRIKCLNYEPEKEEGLHRRSYSKQYDTLFQNIDPRLDFKVSSPIYSREMDKSSFEKYIKNGLKHSDPVIREMCEELWKEHKNILYKK